jgi:hypothetical protein
MNANRNILRREKGGMSETDGGDGFNQGTFYVCIET